jgi:hypothetical protein
MALKIAELDTFQFKFESNGVTKMNRDFKLCDHSCESSHHVSLKVKGKVVPVPNL